MARSGRSRSRSRVAPAIGATVKKHFPGHGTHTGFVTSHNARQGWWHVKYEDGDEEDLSAKEIAPWLVEDAPRDRKKRRVTKGQRSPFLSFTEFVVERQAVLERRKRNHPRDQWTRNEILRTGRFCNIDRKDDFVTRELIACLKSALGPNDAGLPRRRVLLAIALRFTSSRRGEAANISRLVCERPPRQKPPRKTPRQRTALEAALLAKPPRVKCGCGTYQMTLSREELAKKIEAAADAVLERVATLGAFKDVSAAAEFVAKQMTVRRRTGLTRPQFSANETACPFPLASPLRLSPLPLVGESTQTDVCTLVHATGQRLHVYGRAAGQGRRRALPPRARREGRPPRGQGG